MGDRAVVGLAPEPAGEPVPSSGAYASIPAGVSSPKDPPYSAVTIGDVHDLANLRSVMPGGILLFMPNPEISDETGTRRTNSVVETDDNRPQVLLNTGVPLVILSDDELKLCDWLAEERQMLDERSNKRTKVSFAARQQAYRAELGVARYFWVAWNASLDKASNAVLFPGGKWCAIAGNARENDDFVLPYTSAEFASITPSPIQDYAMLVWCLNNRWLNVQGVITGDEFQGNLAPIMLRGFKGRTRERMACPLQRFSRDFTKMTDVVTTAKLSNNPIVRCVRLAKAARLSTLKAVRITIAGQTRHVGFAIAATPLAKPCPARRVQREDQEHVDAVKYAA